MDDLGIEAITVRGRKKDVLSPIASEHDMVGGAKVMDARLASHDAFFICLYTQLSSLTPMTLPPNFSCNKLYLRMHMELVDLIKTYPYVSQPIQIYSDLE